MGSLVHYYHLPIITARSDGAACFSRSGSSVVKFKLGAPPLL